MTANLLDGKWVAQSIIDQLAAHIKTLINPVKHKIAIIQIEGDEASTIYVRHKCRVAAKVGILTNHILLPSSVSFEQVQQIIVTLNQDKHIHGILLQLPLPLHLNSESLLNLIDPAKDVDGLTPSNQGLLMQNQAGLRPCTPHGIMKLLAHYQLDMTGKHVVIINASKLVGKPLAMEMLAAKATVTICNSRTQSLEQHVQRADVVISATGKAHFVPSHWLKTGAIVIDVGVHRIADSLVGDFDFSSAKEIASWITPVPGGVGPMTVACLMENVYTAYNRLVNYCDEC